MRKHREMVWNNLVYHTKLNSDIRINFEFQQFHVLLEKYAFPIPLNILGDRYVTKDHDLDEIDKGSSSLKEKDYSVLSSCLMLKRKEKWGKKALLNSVPNIDVMLRIFLTVSASVPNCENFYENKSDQELLEIHYEPLVVVKYYHTVYRHTK